MYGWNINVTNDPSRTADVVTFVPTPSDLATKGLVAGTEVATSHGWKAVEQLAAGDEVLTFDNGMRRIVAIRSITLWANLDAQVPASSWPVHVPGGALGNRRDLVLLPDQGVLVESDEVCDTHGDPFALVPAQALEGLRGTTRKHPTSPAEFFVLAFDVDEIIEVDDGLLVHCAAVGDTEEMYQLQPLAEARRLIRNLESTSQDAVRQTADTTGATHQALIA